MNLTPEERVCYKVPPGFEKMHLHGYTNRLWVDCKNSCLVLMHRISFPMFLKTDRQIRKDTDAFHDGAILACCAPDSDGFLGIAGAPLVHIMSLVVLRDQILKP